MRVISRHSICILGILLAAGLAAAPVRAHDRWPLPGNFYVDVGGGVEWVNLPELTAFNTNGREFESIDDEVGRWTASMAVGFVDRDGMTLPDPIGQNARIEGRLRYAFGTSDAHARSNAAPLRMQLIDAPAGANGLLVGGDAHFNTSLESWDADLVYQTDLVMSDLLALSPLIGLTYSRLDLDNDYKGVSAIGGSVELNDDTTTDYYGLALGTDIALRPVDGLEFVLGLRGDFMGASTTMHAHQDNFGGESSESDGDTDFAIRGTASLGMNLTLGPMTLGVEGYARYLSHLAVAVHPTSATDSVSHIGDENLWSAGVKGSLTIWFP